MVIADALDGTGFFAGVLAASGDYDVAAAISNTLLYLAVGGVAAWAFGVLGGSERRRVEAEAALAEERAARIRIENGSRWRPFPTIRSCRPWP
jgi:hypothetical protein